VPPAEIFDYRHQLVEPIETFHRGGEHLHQLLALFRHVASKHRAQFRSYLEQALIEQHRGVVGNRHDRGKRGLHKFSLNLGHHG
jgi:hypothetical protein